VAQSTKEVPQQGLLSSVVHPQVCLWAVQPRVAAQATQVIEFHMTTQWSLLHDADIIKFMDGVPFRLSCNGQSLFAGVFYIIYGQAALDTPVLHPDRDVDNAVILRLGAWASFAAGSHPGEKERIDRPELRSVLCQRGALRVLNPSDVPPSQLATHATIADRTTRFASRGSTVHQQPISST